MPSVKKSVVAPVSVFAVGSDPLVFGPPGLVSLPSMLAGFTATPPTYEPKAAEALLEVYRARLSAIPADRVDHPRVDVDAVARALLGVYSLTQFPPVTAIFQAAAAQQQFDMGNLNHLRDLALGLLHVYRQAVAAGAFRMSKISAELDAESAEVEARIQRLCEHFFSEHAVIGPVLRQLSPGTGYLDRAYDLLGYADICEEQEAIVSKDPVYYRTTDVADARRIAGEILAETSATMGPQAKAAYDLLRRVWLLVKAVYFEVQQVGLAGLRYDPLREERFPSVYSVGRKGQGRPKAPEAKVAEAKVAEAKTAEAVKDKKESGDK